MQQEWDTTLAFRLVTLIARRAETRFGKFPDYDIDDLISVGLMAIAAAWPNYDPTKTLSTFMYMVAWRRLRDLHRDISSRRRLEVAATDRTPEPATDRDPKGELVNFAERLYRQSQIYLEERGLPLVLRQRRDWRGDLNIAQRMTMFAIVQKLGLSHRQAEHLFRTNDELRAVLQLNRAPGRMYFSELGQRMRQLKRRVFDPAGEAAAAAAACPT